MLKTRTRIFWIVCSESYLTPLDLAKTLCVVKEQLVQEQEQLRQECLHLRSRLDAAQTECQKEREVRTGRAGSAILGMGKSRFV